jgi:hypothetical protein
VAGQHGAGPDRKVCGNLPPQLRLCQHVSQGLGAGLRSVPAAGLACCLSKQRGGVV